MAQKLTAAVQSAAPTKEAVKWHISGGSLKRLKKKPIELAGEHGEGKPQDGPRTKISMR